MSYPSISLSEIKGAIDNALDDMYSDGVISASIYNKKSTERFLVWAINNADRHICLQTALSTTVRLFVPSGQKTVFFERQQEYISQYMDEHEAISTSDAQQFALLFEDYRRLDVVSVLSTYANVYEDLPVEESASPKNVMYYGLPEQVNDPSVRKYQTTTGDVYSEVPNGNRFYVEPNTRKLILSKPADANKWLEFEAQVAPVSVLVTELDADELTDYQIMSPYWAKDWLIFNAITRIAPPPACNQYGYYELEAKARAEAFQNKPGTGNVIISGNELDGNYEGDINF